MCCERLSQEPIGVGLRDANGSNQCLVFADGIDGQTGFTANQYSCRVSHAHHLVNLPARFLDEFDGLWTVEGQPERLAASASNETLETKLPVILRGAYVAGRKKVHCEPTLDRAHSGQEFELAPHILFVQVHRDPLKNEERRS